VADARRINLKNTYVLYSGPYHIELDGETSRGGHYRVRFNVDRPDLVCAISKLGRMLAEQIQIDLTTVAHQRKRMDEINRKIQGEVPSP